MYTALILDDISKSRLINKFGNLPEGWELICHHMTINLGNSDKGPASELIGQEFDLMATSFAYSENIIAVGVETVVPSVNRIKHITIAVNRSKGGSPKLANLLTHWEKLDSPIPLKGTVQTVN